MNRRSSTNSISGGQIKQKTALSPPVPLDPALRPEEKAALSLLVRNRPAPAGNGDIVLGGPGGSGFQPREWPGCAPVLGLLDGPCHERRARTGASGGRLSPGGGPLPQQPLVFPSQGGNRGERPRPRPPAAVSPGLPGPLPSCVCEGSHPKDRDAAPRRSSGPFGHPACVGLTAA